MIVFYKAILNSEWLFNIAILDFFSLFCPVILTFLFAIVYCSINKYQGGRKVIIFFYKKTV